MQGWFNMYKLINVIHYISRKKYTNHMIISMDTENIFDRIQHFFMVKTLNKLSMKVIHLNVLKAIYDKPIYAFEIDAFDLWCWGRLLWVPCTTRRSNQSITKEISPKYSLEGLMLKLKLQYFGHLMQRTDSLEKILMLGKIEGRKRRGQQRMR